MRTEEARANSWKWFNKNNTLLRRASGRERKAEKWKVTNVSGGLLMLLSMAQSLAGLAAGYNR